MITVDEVYKRTTDYEIFCHYLGTEPKSSEKILSPLREETNPSFNIYETPSGWRFKDYGSGDEGNCFDLVKQLFRLTFVQALEKVNDDMKLGIAKEKEKEKTDDELAHCKVISGKHYKMFARPLTVPELEWWAVYGITPDILSQYGVVPVEAYDAISKKNKPYRMSSSPSKYLFAYPYSNTCMKIYQPKAEKKEYKFFYLDPKEREKEFVFGLEQIQKAAQEKETVFWTGGEKDVMTLRAMGFNAITGTSETGRMPKSVVEDLRARGFEVVILFDNDETGTFKSDQFSKEFGIKRLVLPEMTSGGKDISDYAKLKLPKEEIVVLAERAEVGVQDAVVQSGKDQPTVVLADNEFAHSIWSFRYDKNGIPVIKGIYRYGLMLCLAKMGYFKLCRDNNSYLFVMEKDNVIEEVEGFMIKNAVQNHILLAGDLRFVYDGDHIEVNVEKLMEMFLRQTDTIFSDNFMTHLTNHEKPILRDDKNSSFFFFKHQVARATKDGIEIMQYSSLGNFCIWRKRIIDRELTYVQDYNECHFARFIANVTSDEEKRRNAFRSAIGYLLHNYVRPTSGQAVIAYDEEITDIKDPKGGTGKGVLANSIKMLRDVAKIDGKKFDPKGRFKFQNVTDSTQVVWFDETRDDFDFSVLHSCLTDGWNIENKYEREYYIKPADSPKTLICSNATLKGGGTTNKRRQFVIEFSNHYSQQIRSGVEEPIRTEHGCTFFDNEDWDAAEWSRFFSFMLDCSVYYLQNGLQSYEHKSVELNRLRQSTSEEFCAWVQAQNFETDKEYATAEYFDDFVTTYYGSNSDFHQRGFTNWMKEFARSKKWEFRVKRSHSVGKFSFHDTAEQVFVPLF